MNKLNKRQKTIKDIVIIALLTATLTGGKYALSFIPNIEIVTLLILCYAFVFGLKISLSSTLIFVTIEGFLYGFNTWLISYYIYWPLLCICGCLLSIAVKRNKTNNLAENQINNKNNIIKIISYTALAVILTAFFGVISSFIDALIGAGKTSYTFYYLFPIIYLRGIAFYLAQIISNALIISVCFLPLTNLLSRLSIAYYKVINNYN